MRRILFWALAAAAALALAVQLVPYGRDHVNPPVHTNPPWDARTAQLARAACLDCHSNETTWPWYSNVAPVSWLVEQDVDRGRAKINFSEWGTPQAGEEAGGEDLAETVQEGEMPPSFYIWLHPEAGLSSQERQELATGLARLGGGDGGGNEEEGEEESEE